MAINSSISQDKVESLVEFPKLMQSTINGSIVLFQRPRVGMLVSGSNDFEYVGYFCESWYMDRFIDFEGSVTLSNL